MTALTKSTPLLPLKTRIMRLISFILMGGGIILAVVFGATLIINRLQQYQQAHQSILSDISQEIGQYTNESSEKMVDVATSQTMGAFILSITETSSALTERDINLGITAFEQVELLLQSGGGDFRRAYVVVNGIPEIAYQFESDVVQSADAYAPENYDALINQTITLSFGEVLFTPIRVMGENQVLTMATPIPHPANGSVNLGVLVIDLALIPISEILATAPIDLVLGGNNREFMLLSGDTVLLDSATLAVNPEAVIASVPISSKFSPRFLSVYQQNEGIINFERIDGQYVSSVVLPLVSTDNQSWRLVVTDLTSVVLGNTPILASLSTLLILLGSGLTVLFIDRWMGRNLRILSTSGRVIQQIKMEGGEEAIHKFLDTQELAVAQTEEDVYILEGIRDLSSQVKNLKRQIEVQTTKYNTNFEVASKVSREVARLTGLRELMQHTALILIEDFKLNYVQFLLLDSTKRYLTHIYGLDHRGHGQHNLNFRIDRRTDSLVVQALTQGIQIANDYVPNEPTPIEVAGMLSKARSRAVLPLRISNDTEVGVLDLYADRPFAFKPEDNPSYILIATQVASGVYKNRLLDEQINRNEQLNAMNQKLTTMAISEVISENTLAESYRYQLTTGEMQDAKEYKTADLLNIPIRIRGAQIGSIAVASPIDTRLGDNDRIILNAVADRVGLAVENARLLQETQYNLTETEILYKTSSNLNQSDTMEDLVQSLFQSLTTDAYSGQVFIFDAYVSEATPPEWAEVITSVYKDELINESSATQRLVGTRLKLSDYHFFSELNNSQVLIVEDVQHDERIDPSLHYMLNQWGGGALVIIPLTVRGSWRGFIMVNYLKRRAFSRREVEIIANLLGPIGVAIDNRLLLVQTNDALARNRRLYESSRIINQAESLSDLIYGVQTTADLDDLEFMISVFEGEERYEGWPVNIRLVAYSENGKVNTLDQPYLLRVDENSPMRLGDYQIVTDTYPDQEPPNGWVHLLRDLGFRYAVIFPLITSNNPVALFWVIRKQINQLPQRDTEVYKALSEQMSTVIQNRSLFEQTQNALNETRRLYEAGRAMSDANTREGIYTSAVKYLDVEAQAIHRISIWHPERDLTPQTPYLRLIYPNTETNFTLSQRLQNVVSYMGNEQARIFTTIELFREFDAFYNYLAAAHTNSLIIVQLRTRQNWFGLILIESQERDTFTDSYRRYAQAIADQVAVGLENALLFDEIQQEARQALALAKAAQLVSLVGTNIQYGLRRMLEQVAEATGSDRWLFVRYQDEVITPLVVHNMGDLPIYEGIPFDNVEDALHAVVDAIANEQIWSINNPKLYGRYSKYDDQVMSQLGKHLVARVASAPEKVIGALSFGRSLEDPDWTEREETLMATLTAQLSVALESEQLYARVESERAYLDSILTTLPAGVLVLHGQTLVPIQTNAQVVRLLEREVDTELPFNSERYNLYHTGTDLFYSDKELPIYRTLISGQQTFVDDVTVILPNGAKRDLLLNAAPILHENGTIESIILTFEDISNLRNLENSLQDNLRDQVTLYEATRSFAQATDLNEILDVLFTQLINLQSSDVHIIIVNSQTGQLEVERAYRQSLQFEQFPSSLFVNKKPLFIEDLHDFSPLSVEEQLQLEGLGYRSLAVIPLLVSQSEEPFGWFIISYDQPHIYTTSAQGFLNTLSDNGSISIDNRLLFQSTNVALNETTKLYRATTAISQSADLISLSEALMDVLSDIQADFFVALIRSSTIGGGFIELAKSPNLVIPNLYELITKYNLIDQNEAYLSDLATATSETVLVQFARELHPSYPVSSLAIVNLRVRSIPEGVILIGSKHPTTYSVDEKRLLSATSNSASLVMDNIFLLDQVQESLEETSTLYQSSKSISQSSNVDEILEVIVERIIPPSMNQVFIALLDGTTWQGNRVSVHIQSSWQRNSGLELEGISLTSEQFPAWRQLSSRSVLTIDDIWTDPNLTDLERLGIESLDTRALAILPMYTTTRAIGSIWISSNEPYTFTEREQRIYQAFVEQVSLSMEASFLIEQTEKRARQLETSAQVSQRVSSVLDLNELLPDIVNLVREQFSYDHVQIFLIDEVENFAVLRASTGEAGQQLLSINHKLEVGSASVIGQVTRNAEPTIALDTADARVIHRPNAYLPLTRSELALPISIQGRVIGALDVQSNQPNAFDQDDVSVLGTLASQLAVAIENARLFDEAESRADEMSFLFTLSTAASSAGTLDEALQNVADLLLGTLQELDVCIYLVYPHATNADLKILRPVASAGQETAYMPPLSEIEEVILGDEKNAIGYAALDSIPNNIENLEDDPTYLPLSTSARSAVIMPLNSGATGGGAENIGVVAVESTKLGAFKQEGLTVLLALSNALATIVQSARYYDELQEAYQQLKELDRLKSDFLANMSHELRTPLNSIIGFSRVMLKGIDGPLSEMQEQDLNTIYNSGQHLLGLINDILDQAKIAADKMSLDREYFDITKVVDGVRSIGIGLVKEKPVDIMLNVAKNLPSAYGDEFRTRQVLLNLVSNSAKFTLQGTITISVYLQRSPKEQDMVRVDVADTGIGIAEKDIPTLFEAFRQVDSSLTRTVGGTGLGLPIAKSLVELQGGEMFVQSKVGIGSIFSIILPLGPVDETDTTEADDDEPSMVVDQPTFTQIPNLLEGLAVPPPGLFQQKRQVLLIEDNPNMVDQYRRTIQGEGFEVLAASIPLEAEAMASGLRPTLIVMDVNFANGQGWRILETLKDRDDTFDIPVIVCTLNDESERAFKLGAYDFLSRPIMPEDLVKSVLSAEKDSNIDRVLIIDDQPSSTRLLEQALLTAGQYRVFAAHTGPEGIALVARRRPDLIILDLRMPEMDGFRVLEELRSHPESAKIPVIVVTSDSNLTNNEREQLVNLDIIYKTDLNQDNYQSFINEVRRHIARYNGE
ncbi:MAG: GAF domain-containing protein [Phototrophicaceae bacterium]